MNGVLEFVDTQDMTVMAQTEHFMATDVEWDPTGRFVTSAVSWWGHKVGPLAGIHLTTLVHWSRPSENVYALTLFIPDSYLALLPLILMFLCA